jgi:ADP-ribose pyrophosphatase
VSAGGPDSSDVAFEGRHIRVVVERWGDHSREIVESPNAVTIVPVDEEGCVTFVRQLREAAGRELLELPAGGIDPGETPLECAKRELREEAGLTGGTWRRRSGFFTVPGICREWMELFFAEGLVRGEAAPVADEQIERVRVPLAEIPALLSELEDAKTLVGLLLYLRDSAGSG